MKLLSIFIREKSYLFLLNQMNLQRSIDMNSIILFLFLWCKVNYFERRWIFDITLSNVFLAKKFKSLQKSSKLISLISLFLHRKLIWREYVVIFYKNFDWSIGSWLFTIRKTKVKTWDTRLLAFSLPISRTSCWIVSNLVLFLK